MLTVKSQYKKPPLGPSRGFLYYYEIYSPVQILAGQGPCCLCREVSHIETLLYNEYMIKSRECQNGQVRHEIALRAAV